MCLLQLGGCGKVHSSQWEMAADVSEGLEIQDTDAPGSLHMSQRAEAPQLLALQQNLNQMCPHLERRVGGCSP